MLLKKNLIFCLKNAIPGRGLTCNILTLEKCILFGEVFP